MAPFNAGDRVKINRPGDWTHGQEGAVWFPHLPDTLGPTIRLDATDGLHVFEPECLEPLPPLRPATPE